MLTVMGGISLHNGARILSKGLRTSSPPTAALGAFILALVAIRRIEAADPPAVYRTKLRPGESLEVIVIPGQRASSSRSRQLRADS